MNLPRLLICLVLLTACSSAPFFTPLPQDDNGQFYAEHPGRPAVLIIHGLSATPWEVKTLSIYLAEHHYTVLAPVLAGHGRSPADLEATTWQDWYTNVNESYARLAAVSTHVFVIGVSTGGSLALELGKEYPLAGIVTIGAPVTLRDTRTKYAKLASNVLRWTPHTVLPEEEGHYYPVLPTKTIAELNKLIAQTVADAPSVKEPVLLIQSRVDPTVDPSSANDLYLMLGSQDKRILWLDSVTHTVIRDDTQGAVLADILKFLNAREK
ncbi:MAG TPA: alpha/beta fold hydrolase [Candidatus Binatia bacterium]|nr:alpha/beta fold hydrolase [Candidatus Binatia bacterium]